jgi:hypothetical protein
LQRRELAGAPPEFATLLAANDEVDELPSVRFNQKRFTSGGSGRAALARVPGG